MCHINSLPYILTARLMILEEMKILFLPSGLSLSMNPLLVTESNCAAVMWGTSRWKSRNSRNMGFLHTWHAPATILWPCVPATSLLLRESLLVCGCDWCPLGYLNSFEVSTTINNSMAGILKSGGRCELWCSVGGVWPPNLCAFVILVWKNHFEDIIATKSTANSHRFALARFYEACETLRNYAYLHVWDNNPVRGTNVLVMIAVTDFQFRQGQLRSGQTCTVHVVVIFCSLGQPK